MARTQKLTLKEKVFCKVYVETFNGTKAAIDAYTIRNKRLLLVDDPKLLSTDDQKARNKAYDTAAHIASENLRKPHIMKKIDELLEKTGLSEANLRIEHAKLIHQDDDLTNKARAIDMYYKKTGAYAAKRVEGQLDVQVREFFDEAARMMGK